MFDTQFSKRVRLMWVGLALLLHAALLFAVPGGGGEPVRIPAPIQVSLLDPAPASDAAEPAESAYVAPEPLPPTPVPPVKPMPAPKPLPELPPETPRADIPTAEPVAAVQTLASASSASASSAASAENTSASGSGDALVEARFDVDYLRNPKPVYPPMSQRLREEGKVMLRVFVSPDGSPQDIEIKQSSGSARLDEAAKATVHRWRFVPARRGNAAVAAWVVVPIAFKLES
ncbi:hypothetical protein AGMMS49545_13440 [Betaproteobacteria bacterium]|nr:hypothetical protein AGMMS49545_13440 [Betaproteobacteria bacterium]GHU47339.1 hypothetical protein AGMMS50289_22370 [Betaproteobacteria bacterium]